MKLKRVIGWSAGVMCLALLVTGLVGYVTSGNSCDERASAPTHGSSHPSGHVISENESATGGASTSSV